MRSLASMRPHMRGEMTRVDKPLLTQMAVIGFLAGVRADVLCQVLTTVECLTTCVTLVLFRFFRTRRRAGFFISGFWFRAVFFNSERHLLLTKWYLLIKIVRTNFIYLNYRKNIEQINIEFQLFVKSKCPIYF